MPTGVDGSQTPIVLLDTSTAIALIVEDHESHRATLAAVRGRRLGFGGACHAWSETYSVLPRLPAGLRRSPADALRVLEINFPASSFLGETEAADLGPRLARLGLSGGSVFDGLVGAAAHQHRRTLLSGDARARPTYEALGVELEPLG